MTALTIIGIVAYLIGFHIWENICEKYSPGNPATLAMAIMWPTTFLVALIDYKLYGRGPINVLKPSGRDNP